MKEFKRYFEFIDDTGRIARVDAEVTKRNKYPEFTASGTYEGGCGQILDNIKPRTREQKLFIELWRKYHLKNLNRIPKNIQFWPDFTGHVNGIIDEIEKQEAERKAAEGKKEGDEAILEMMKEEGINENTLDICKAYLSVTGCDDLQGFEESYSGQFSSDEEFAQDMAEQLGSIDKNLTWPNYCIDWEHAASELMMDYSEQDGYYFRNL